MNQVALQRPFSIKSRLQDYVQLTKFKLALLVVFSAAMGFMTAPGAINWSQLLILIVGGFLVTGASNGLNQVLERELDKKMTRTQNRPLPDQRLGVAEATAISLVSGVTGVYMLAFGINLYAGLLGLFALLSYAFIYTPLKRKTPFCVFIGAIPGAVPPLLGWVAATGHFGMAGWVLFAIQFLWQFPHFWAIGYLSYDQYHKAGYKLLPEEDGAIDRRLGRQALIYTCMMIPVIVLGFTSHLLSVTGLAGMILLTGYFLYKAWRFYKVFDRATAKALMFSSFIYLPIALMLLWLGM